MTRDPFENSSTRAIDGAIVTAINTQTGDLRVIHRAGFLWEESSFKKTRGKRVRVSLSFLEVMQRLCREIDAWEGTWLIRTISTPRSIYQDITGGRASGLDAQRYEAHVLTRAGRIDLWEGTYSLEHRERRRQHGLDRNGKPRQAWASKP